MTRSLTICRSSVSALKRKGILHSRRSLPRRAINCFALGTTSGRRVISNLLT
jgi:hypothetical protein